MRVFLFLALSFYSGQSQATERPADEGPCIFSAVKKWLEKQAWEKHLILEKKVYWTYLKLVLDTQRLRAYTIYATGGKEFPKASFKVKLRAALSPGCKVFEGSLTLISDQNQSVLSAGGERAIGSMTPTDFGKFAYDPQAIAKPGFDKERAYRFSDHVPAILTEPARAFQYTAGFVEAMAAGLKYVNPRAAAPRSIGAKLFKRVALPLIFVDGMLRIEAISGEDPGVSAIWSVGSRVLVPNNHRGVIRLPGDYEDQLDGENR